MKYKRKRHLGGRQGQEIGGEEDRMWGEVLTKDWGLKGVKYSVSECTLQWRLSHRRNCPEYVDKSKKEKKYVKWFYLFTF